MQTDRRVLTDEMLARARNGVTPEEYRTELDPFLLRMERHLPDLLDGLERVFTRFARSAPHPGRGSSPERPEDRPPGDRPASRALQGFGPWLDRLVDLMLRHHAARPRELRRLDLRRTLRPDWFQLPEQLGYVCYVDRFGGTLAGVMQHLDHLQQLGVTYLHLMPLLKPRPGNSDGGYAVADFREVHPALGTMDELSALAAALRQRGISLCIDVVLNHVAREHAWARAAREGDAAHRRYFWVFARKSHAETYERTLPEVFPEFAPGNFTWDEELGGWVWTTFNAFQWDLNWTNPDVLMEFVDLVLYLANRGVEVFRLDAIAFIWKRLGTDCQNQPEVHALVQVLRAAARIVAPAVVFKAEAIVGPDRLTDYLGRGVHHGKVSDLAYHNSLMVQIWSSLASRDTRLMTAALGRLPPRPASCAWVTYLRCHDDIGWAVSDEDAAAVGLDGPTHRQFLADYYAGQFHGSHARGEPFQINPRTGDRRSSGTTASLNGLELALERNDDELLQLSIERILLGYAVLMAFDGIPLIYMGDEIGLTNDRDYLQDPDRATDNRWMHRPPMPWDRVQRRHLRGSVEQRIFDGLCRLIEARKRTPQLHAASPVEVLDTGHPAILALARPHPLGRLTALFNFTETPQQLAPPRGASPFDCITERPVELRQGLITLPPYGRVWLLGE